MASVVAVALLAPAGGAIAWLIVRDVGGWEPAAKIGVVALGVMVGAAIAAVFGPPLFQLWLDRHSPPAQTTATPAQTTATPVEQARGKGALEERKQDREAMGKALRGVKDVIFPNRNS